MSFPGFAIGAQQEEQARARKQELADEKRKTTLKTLLEDAETPQDKVAAIEAVYHQDPSVLKQHVENLTRRLTGKPPQPVVSPADAQAGRLAPIAARGKTPAQQQEEIYNRELAAETAAKERINAAKPLPASKPIYKEYTSPDGKQRQWFKVDEVPEGWTATQGATLAPKPGTPHAGTSNGRNVFGVLTPQGWVDPNTQQPIPDFRPLPTYAQVAPSLRAIEVVDPNNPSATKIESVPQAIKSGAEGTRSAEFKLQMPTSQERGRGDLASSARDQLQDMVDILNKRKDLFGPIAGRGTNFQQWIGSQDPDAQAFASAARIASDHLAGVFGGRSQAALEQIYNTIGKNTTNPAAAIAGIHQMDKAAQNIEAKGKGRGAPAPGGGAPAKKGTVSLAKARTLPQYKGKSDAEIKAAAEQLGYEVKP